MSSENELRIRFPNAMMKRHTKKGASRGLKDTSGKTVALGRVLGRGGEGAVWDVVARSGLVAKIYHRGMDPDLVAKTRVMITQACEGVCEFSAWPEDLILDKSGRPCGILLPKVLGGRPIYDLYGPKSRLRYFPHANFAFMLEAAANVARAFAVLHEAGIVIGDVNGSGVFVLQDATVRLIDCDSFQIQDGNKVYGCHVGVGPFTPPELKGLSLRTTLRSVHHDNFGLAVLIFHLLFQGRHPFAGRSLGGQDVPIETAIADYKFCYGDDAGKRGMAPPPHAPALGTFPAPLPAFLQRAFGCDPSGRPSARDWVGALATAATSLRPCRFEPAHVYPSTAGSCPWCAIERAAGVVLFSSAARPIAKADDRLLQIIKVIDAIEAPVLPLPVALESLPKPTASGSARQASRYVRRLKYLERWAAVGFFVSLALIVGTYRGSFTSLLVAAAAVIVAAEVGCIVLLARFERAMKAASEVYQNALTKYEALRVRGVPAAAALIERRTQLQTVKKAWLGLPQQHLQGIKRLERRQAEDQVKARLRSNQIKHARISGLGRPHVSYLASFGIVTAADITEIILRRGPAIGRDLKDALLHWRKSLERQAIAGAKPLDAWRVRAHEDAMGRRRQDLERQLTSGVDELYELLRQVEVENAVEVERLNLVAAALMQAQSDLRRSAVRSSRQSGFR